mmetsp:Transcript_2454/g.9006  ORF Transcript_2454/g.9006 Transcript_2454/m.9006 type:complete len:83 (+) Transcript_2454:377-625(+)
MVATILFIVMNGDHPQLRLTTTLAMRVCIFSLVLRWRGFGGELEAMGVVPFPHGVNLGEFGVEFGDLVGVGGAGAAERGGRL